MVNLKQVMSLKDEVKKKKKDVANEESKSRLNETTTKKIKTTMIGAIASLERHFGFLWAHGTNKDLTEDEEYMSGLFQKVRKEILDNGNLQIKSMEKELNNYDLEWKRYTLTLPVRDLGEENEG